MAPAAVWKQISRWQRAIIGSKIAAEQKRFMIGYNEVSRKYLSIKERLRQAQARFRDEELRIRRKLVPPLPHPRHETGFLQFSSISNRHKRESAGCGWE